MICCDVCTAKVEATAAVCLFDRAAVLSPFTLGSKWRDADAVGTYVCDEHLEDVRAAVRSVLAPGTCPVCGRIPGARGCASPFHEMESA